MTEREALKLALDAFGEIAWSNETQWQRDRAKEAITVIKEALAQSEQELVATWENKYGMKEWEVHALRAGWSLTPPQRKPLTDEEVRAVIRAGEYDSMEEFARAIEAAHGIKGEA